MKMPPIISKLVRKRGLFSWSLARPENRLNGSSAPRKHWLGLFYWFLAWGAVVVLQMVQGEFMPVGMILGQLSPGTIVASTDFDYQETPFHRVLPLSPAARARLFMISGQQNAKSIAAGTVLVKKGQKITPEIIAKLQVHQACLKQLEPFGVSVLKFMGDALLLLLGLIISAQMFRLLKPETMSTDSSILLFVLISLLSLIPAKLCLLLGQQYLTSSLLSLEYLMPLALAPLLAAMLLGRISAVIVGFWVSFVASVFAGYNFQVFVVGLVITIMITWITYNVRTRARVLAIGFWTGIAGAVCVLSFAMLNHQAVEITLGQCLSSVISGVLSGMLALLLLPLLEILFRISTDISLLELADMEHPILKRLAMEAPGTYHHSLMVANLAQAAVGALGGNALRTTICSYFHDIGKLVKPEFFLENIQFRENPHDELTPSMSTLVIIAHVKEGLLLARRYKLPQIVMDTIQQHHGTGLVFYFYHKAAAQQEFKLRSRARNGTGIDEETFRYPGPKPSTREAVIISLADAVEAGSRSLEKLSSIGVEDLVNNSVEAKLRDGQLDNCDLTMAQLNRIKKVFIFTLINMLHSRMSYPADENHHKRQTADNAG